MNQRDCSAKSASRIAKIQNSRTVVCDRVAGNLRLSPCLHEKRLLSHIHGIRLVQHTINRDRQTEEKEQAHDQRLLAEVVMQYSRDEKSDKARQHTSHNAGGKTAAMARPAYKAEQENNVGHHKPQPRRQCRQTTLHRDLNDVRMKVALIVVEREGANVPLHPMDADGLHSHAEPWMVLNEAKSILPHQGPEVSSRVLSVHQIEATRVLDPKSRRQYEYKQRGYRPDTRPPPHKHHHGNEATGRQSAECGTGFGGEHSRGQGDEGHGKKDAQSGLPRRRDQKHRPRQAANLHQHLGEHDVVAERALRAKGLSSHKLQVRRSQSAGNESFAGDHRLMLMKGKTANVSDAQHATRRTVSHSALQLRGSVHLTSVDAGDDVIAVDEGLMLERQGREDVSDPHAYTVGILPCSKSRRSQPGKNQQEHEDAHLTKPVKVLGKQDTD